MHMTVAGQDGAWRERTQAQRLQVELALHSGIGGEEYLEATVEQEAVGTVVGAHAPAGGVGRLQHTHVVSRLDQHLCARQACQTCPYNQYHRVSPHVTSLRLSLQQRVGWSLAMEKSP